MTRTPIPEGPRALPEPTRDPYRAGFDRRAFTAGPHGGARGLAADRGGDARPGDLRVLPRPEPVRRR